MTTPSWNTPPLPEPGGAGTGLPPGQLPGTMVTIGDIVCTQFEVVTPSGRCPIGRVTWSFTDMSRTTRAIPAWAIVCAVVFFVFCFLGLLFLLAKEDRTEGSVQVVVQGPGLLHQIQLPVASVAQVQDYSARVGYARSLTASASQMGI
ncbi:hypothetical protein OHV05_26990 [Kitasatospora sp. NBC_00070]|uniref:hypothetical protein n=1 Tax=Kitasatospora sp. NBC_00070 TaxID=2975962 RepID=UPI0032434F6A